MARKTGGIKMNDSPLQIMMIRAKHELKNNVAEIQRQSGLPAYLLSSILSEIIADLSLQEKEELAVLFLHKDDNATQNNDEVK